MAEHYYTGKRQREAAEAAQAAQDAREAEQRAALENSAPIITIHVYASGAVSACNVRDAVTRAVNSCNPLTDHFSRDFNSANGTIGIVQVIPND